MDPNPINQDIYNQLEASLQQFLAYQQLNRAPPVEPVPAPPPHQLGANDLFNLGLLAPFQQPPPQIPALYPPPAPNPTVPISAYSGLHSFKPPTDMLHPMLQPYYGLNSPFNYTQHYSGVAEAQNPAQPQDIVIPDQFNVPGYHLLTTASNWSLNEPSDQPQESGVSKKELFSQIETWCQENLINQRIFAEKVLKEYLSVPLRNSRIPAKKQDEVVKSAYDFLASSDADKTNTREMLLKMQTEEKAMTAHLNYCSYGLAESIRFEEFTQYFNQELPVNKTLVVHNLDAQVKKWTKSVKVSTPQFLSKALGIKGKTST
uniref:CUT domain-containing protein n=1 Tax=Caenorhabditis tropicalis TaxID=1561998 RepID=A0A1I7UVE3_9PELO